VAKPCDSACAITLTNGSSTTMPTCAMASAISRRRNQAGSLFDIRNQLPGIKAKTLILHVKNDQWLRYVLAEEAAKKIPGAKLESFENPLAQYAVFQVPNVLPEPIKAFLKEIGM
jgi:pimeloyl-ACP methyl ester carboxylesterase